MDMPKPISLRALAAGFKLRAKAGLAGKAVAGCLAARGEAVFLEAQSELEGGSSMVKDERRFVNTRETATYLGLSPHTLDGYRVSGAGSAFHRFGNRARCRKMDLDA